MADDKIMEAVHEQRNELTLQIADRLRKQHIRSGNNFMKLAIAALEVIDEWRA